jgi:hypothetical protein
MGAFLTSRCAFARGKRPDFQFLPRGIGPCAGTMRHGGGDGKQYGSIVSTVSSNIVDALRIERSMYDDRLCWVFFTELYGRSRVTSRTLVTCHWSDSFMTALLAMPDFCN